MSGGVKVTIPVANTGPTIIGRLGENEYKRIAFPIAIWLELYPGATFTLLHKRPGDEDGYPVAATETDANNLYWSVAAADLAYTGCGMAELIIREGESIAKSILYPTQILPALGNTETPPEPWESWVDDVIDAANEATASAQEAEAASQAVQDMGVGATTLMPGNDATVTKTVDPDTGAVTLTFGIPAGEPGTGISVHICSSDEYDPTTRIPTVQDPEENTFYLVPSEDGASPDLFVEWIYTAGAWEQFGSATIDLSGYATVADTVLTTTLSRGRKAGTTVGIDSFAFGSGVEASALRATAFGTNTIASSNNAFAEGAQTIASGVNSHAEGNNTQAIGNYSHAEGRQTIANGTNSHAEGRNTIVNGTSQHAAGMYNVADSHDSWPEWVASTSYEVGDKVKVTTTVDSETTVTGYICKTANSDASFTAANWTKDTYMNFAEIIGNGTGSNARSNARTLDWYGNERLAGDVYVGCNNDSTGGMKLAKVSDIPTVPVTDVQVNGTSVVTDGVASVPVMSANTLGVARLGDNNGLYGLKMGTGSLAGCLMLNPASDSNYKQATGTYNPVTSANQHLSIFYGLAKAAGDSTQSSSSNAVGAYTESAKSAISEMLGGSVAVSGSTPTINAKAGISYVCGEVSTLDIAVPESGCFDVAFESGSTPTALSIPMLTGYELIWENGFDPTSLDANTVYEINLRLLGTRWLGVAGAWATT